MPWIPWNDFFGIILSQLFSYLPFIFFISLLKIRKRLHHFHTNFFVGKFFPNKKKEGKRKTNQKSQNFWRRRVSEREREWILKENNNSITSLIAQSFSCLPSTKKGGKHFALCVCLEKQQSFLQIFNKWKTLLMNRPLFVLFVHYIYFFDLNGNSIKLIQV